MLVEHNHSWNDIRTYTLSETGVFLRECIIEEHKSTKQQILANWLGTNADGDYIKDHVLNVGNMPLTKAQKDAAAKEEADESRKQWKGLLMSMGKHGMRH